MLMMLKAGNYVRDDVVSSTIQLISETSSQQVYMAQQLWQALERDTADRQPLTQVATWCIGEYGDSLLYSPDSPVKVTQAVHSSLDSRESRSNVLPLSYA